ncbi:snapalysin family zinc-dependent metalloprotease [Streptomyces sp. MP131-18]|uniref:snapalysin family zinc-dependent metalloprotease n=1 Tax=Streptomyces sp. MP131-18 TaxID=1857892 RepID=UPI00097CAA13|nr:snapalysin family zinc-dependent metalloprotease [Streptomyces sp. MP131-18]ONK10430.1 Extracellular small neutral protease precursor [Streptomyces sp. MP131-18]
MRLKPAARALVAALVTVLALTWTAGQASAAPSAAAVVVTYDTSRAAEFVDAVHSGAAVWNESVANVRLEPAAPGEDANVEIIADDGWPRALTTSLGNGTVWMGRQAVDQGYDTTRIAAHELGHILGLPDMKPGPCSSLMSGSTGGVSCTNPYPDAAERAEVEDNFAAALAGAAAHGPRFHRN